MTDHTRTFRELATGLRRIANRKSVCGEDEAGLREIAAGLDALAVASDRSTDCRDLRIALENLVDAVNQDKVQPTMAVKAAADAGFKVLCEHAARGMAR